MKRFTVLAIAAAMAFGWAAEATAQTAEQPQEQQVISFRQGRGRDTVGSSKYSFVGITDKGTKATINGEDVHVYKTGAFGKDLVLKPGDNIIEVGLRKGADSRNEKIHVFYDAGARLRNQGKPAAEPQLSARLLYVETTEGAYLQYGSGTDRLGGSKMAYLDTGIVLKVVGEIENLYKVQLSEARFAYIDKEYVKETARSTKTVNTNNMSLTNIGNRDRISISLPMRLPYAPVTHLGPTCIDVDIFGAMNNSNWITQSSELGMIDYVDAQQIEGDVFRLHIVLKEKYAWGFSVSYSGTSLIIDVKHRPELTLKGMKIGLDAGHGGELPGAISVTGINEKDCNLTIVYNLKRILEEKGAIVTLSRPDDSNISMVDRKKVFRDADVDLVVSIHNNAGGSPNVPMGTSTYYKHIVNRDLAKILLDHMLELGMKNFGLTGNFNFSLNAPTEYPNALVECLFMSSLADEECLADPAYLNQIAVKVADGLEDYLKTVRKSLK